MAKKKTKESITTQSTLHPDQMIYALLNMMNVAKDVQEIVPNYVEKDNHISIAIPSIRFGLSFISDDPTYSNDDAEYFAENGWTI